MKNVTVLHSREQRTAPPLAQSHNHQPPAAPVSLAPAKIKGSQKRPGEDQPKVRQRCRKTFVSKQRSQGPLTPPVTRQPSKKTTGTALILFLPAKNKCSVLVNLQEQAGAIETETSCSEDRPCSRLTPDAAFESDLGRLGEHQRPSG